jgi:glycerol kinase
LYGESRLKCTKRRLNGPAARGSRLIDTVPAVKAGLEDGTALVGTVDAWLAWNLTGWASHGP